MKKPERIDLRGALHKVPTTETKQWRPTINHDANNPVEKPEDIDAPDAETPDEGIEAADEGVVETPNRAALRDAVNIVQAASMYQTGQYTEPSDDARKQKILDKLDARHEKRNAATIEDKERELEPEVIKTEPEPTQAEKKYPLALEIENSRAETTLLRLALSSRGTEGMGRLNRGLKHLDEHGDKIANGTSPERHARAMIFTENMLKHENEYFAALKEHQKSRGFGSVFMEKFKRGGAKLPPEVDALRQKWIDSRADYASHMRSSALERHLTKGTGIEKDKRGLSVLDRYQRRFVTKEVVFGAEEAEQRARMEGLASRDKKGIEKLFDKFSKLPKPAKVLISSALMGIAGGIAVAGGSALGAVGLVMAVPAAVTAGIAMMQKDPKARDRWANIAGGFGLVSVGGVLGGIAETTTRGLHDLFGTRSKADKKLKQNEGLGNLADATNLGKVSGERKKAVRAEEAIDADARLARTIAAVGGGMAVGGAINHEIAGGGFGHFEFGGGHSNVVDHMSIGEHVGGHNINDGERLLGHFAEKLRQNDFSAGNEPLAVHKLNELLKVQEHQSFTSAGGESSAATQLGFEGPDGSTVMQPGDTLSLQHDGLFGQQELVLTRPDTGMSQVLIDSSGQLHPLDPNVWHQLPVHHHEVPQADHSDASPQTESSDNLGAAPEANYNIPGTNDVDLKQMHDDLVQEQLRANAAYALGLKTPLQVDTYNNYMEHLRHYNDLSGSANTVGASPVSVAPTHTEVPVTHTAVPAHTEASPREFGHSAEAVSSSVSASEHLQTNIVSLTHAKGWEAVKNAYAVDVVNVAPHNSTGVTVDEDFLRSKFIEIVKETGVAPTANQSVGEYITAATKNITR